MKILIINLKTADKRRAFQTQQFERLGLAFELVEATHSDAAHSLKDEPYWRSGQRLLRETEKACLISHQRCWERVIADNEPALILEDDALLSQKLPQVLRDVADTQNIDILNLETRSRKIFMGTATAKAPNIRPLYLNRDGAAAYILWPSGAQKLLKNSAREVGLADAVIWCNFELKAYQASPALALQADRLEYYNLPNYLKTQTSISKTDKRFKPHGTGLIDYLTFRSRRIKHQILLAKMQIHFFHKSTKQRLDLVADDFTYLKGIDDGII